MDLFAYLLSKKVTGGGEVVTGTGTSVTLSNTASNNPINITLAPSELTQDGTPSPDNPIDINVITGDNTITVSDSTGNFTQNKNINLGDLEYCEIGNYTDDFIKTTGKNMYDPNQTYSQGQYVNGSWTDNTQRVTTDYMEIEEGATYTISLNTDNQYDVRLLNYNLFDENHNWLGSRTTNGDESLVNKFSHTFTVNIQDSKYIKITYQNSGSTTLPISNVQACNIQFEEGNQTEYVPYGSGEWYLKKNIGKYELTSENIEYMITTINNEFSVPAAIITKSKLGWNNVYTNNIAKINSYQQISSVSDVATGKFATNFNQYSMLLFNSDITDLESARTSLIGTIIYIAQATPTYILLSDTLQDELNDLGSLTAYANETNISQTNDDLAFVITASTTSKITAEVDKTKYILLADD